MSPRLKNQRPVQERAAAAVKAALLKEFEGIAFTTEQTTNTGPIVVKAPSINLQITISY